MAYPLVLPLAEQIERHELAAFLWRTFDVARSSSTQFEGSLSAEAILDIYKTSNPGTQLTTDMVSHMMMYGGYIDNTGELYLKIKPQVFTLLPATTQERILSYCNYAKSLSLRQIMLGNTPDAVDRDIALTTSFRHFIQTQLFNKEFKYWNAIPKGQRNTGINDMYEYYQEWCFKRNYIPESKKDLLSVLEKSGYRVKQGYYKGKSGIRVVTGCVIPQTEEERAKTFEFEGLAVLRLQDRYIFNDGAIIDSFSYMGLQAYIKGRKCTSHVQSSTTQERKEEQKQKGLTSITGGREKVSPSSISGGTQKVHSTKERRTYQRNYAESKQSITSDVRTSDRDTEGEISTNFPSAITGAKNGIHAATKKYGQDSNARAEGEGIYADTDRFLDQVRNVRTGASVSGTDTTKSDGIPITGAAKKAFFTGLRVTYRLAPPGTFNYKAFLEEAKNANLGRMSEEASRALYEEFLRTLKK